MDNRKYYGCETPESVSYLEFGSVNLVKGEKKIWNYWQDQDAYDLYMFARYSRDLFSFRRFFKEKEKTAEKLNEYILKSAHNKLMDYLFKYAGMLAVEEKGMVCECGSSLYGWIDEALACDYVYAKGENLSKIKGFHYIGSDISELMNEGAANFHSDIKMDFSTQDTILGVVKEIKKNYGKKLALFYGLSVSVRYAVRGSEDLIEAAEASELCVYNRLSMTYGEETLATVYGTGKSVYIVSLPKLVKGIEEKGLYAKYCTANMQHNKDGEGTVRASIGIAKSQEVLDEFIARYESCIDKSIQIEGIEKGQWKELKELL
jgi:hypothetical protein